jgi:ferric-dicitrate binding protein FerR (iron transport regulator)
MGRVNDDHWLDEALNEALHSDDTQPDFEKWKQQHPEAVEMLTARTPQTQRPLRIRRIIMNAPFVKLAAAAVIVIAGIVGITQLTKNNPEGTTPANPVVAQQTVTGPATHTFADGSTVRLAQGARIRTYAEAGKRGFEHLAGQIDVTVAKGHGEFIVTSPYGQVKALGTQFTMNMMDEIAANTKERVQLLAVKVKEGTVEVRNPQGTTTLTANQDIVVALNAAPYDFNKDEKLPKELRARIQSMIDALKAKDGAAWVANYNINYVYKLAKGQVAYDPNLFGGTVEDAENLKKNLGNVGSPEELAKMVASSLNSQGGDIYITSITMSKAGDHATARCVSKNGSRTVVTTPQWHNFDGGWWQVDD